MYINRWRTAQTLSQSSQDFGVGCRGMKAAQSRLLASHYAQELLFLTWKQLWGKRNFRIYPQPLQPYTVLHESFPLKLRRWGTQSYHCTRLYKRYKRPFLLKLIAGEWNNLFFFLQENSFIVLPTHFICWSDICNSEVEEEREADGRNKWITIFGISFWRTLYDYAWVNLMWSK